MAEQHLPVNYTRGGAHECPNEGCRARSTITDHGDGTGTCDNCGQPVTLPKRGCDARVP